MNWYKKAIFELSFGVNDIIKEIIGSIIYNLNIGYPITLYKKLDDFLGIPSSRYIPKHDSPYLTSRR